MITLTDAAAAKVKDLIEAEGEPELALRVAVRPGGCSGFSYEMFFDSDVASDDPNQHKKEEVEKKMNGTKISCRARAATFGAAALILAIAGSPRIAGAVQSTCTGAFDLQYTSGPSFPQPVPPGNAGDDQLTVQLTLGAQSIQNGTTLTVADVRFDLDCSDAFATPHEQFAPVPHHRSTAALARRASTGNHPPSSVSWAPPSTPR